MVVKYAGVRCFQSFTIRCVENDGLSECKSSPDLDVRPVAAGQQYDQHNQLGVRLLAPPMQFRHTFPGLLRLGWSRRTSVPNRAPLALLRPPQLARCDPFALRDRSALP